VLNKQLADREFIVGEYSIADIAAYPWVLPERQSQDIEQFPHLKRWKEAIKARPATVRAYALAREINPTAGGVRTEEEKKILFGQTKDVVR
jgi:GST-like protein